MGFGTVILVLLGKTTGALTTLLLLCIVLYDAVHKHVDLSPLLMVTTVLLSKVPQCVALNNLVSHMMHRLGLNVFRR